MPRLVALIVALLAVGVATCVVPDGAAAAGTEVRSVVPGDAVSHYSGWSPVSSPVDASPVADGRLDGPSPWGWPVEGAAVDDRSPAPRWEWPVEGAVVDRPYVAPANRYGAGHRGIDLGASVGAVVLAPTEGVVVFSGRVVDRGVLTLDVGGGVIVSVEPIEMTLRPGDAVARGDPLGTVDVGGHAAAGDLHVGVRVDGEYVDPMRFFGGVTRAVLLPCC